MLTTEEAVGRGGEKVTITDVKTILTQLNEMKIRQTSASERRETAAVRWGTVA